jgi:hypothetical protein
LALADFRDRSPATAIRDCSRRTGVAAARRTDRALRRGRQHVVATSELLAGDVRTIDLHGTIDHPGRFVGLTPAGSDRARQARVSQR